MDPAVVFARLGLALALGLLVGLQRQRSESELAGIRTFPLATAFGTVCGLLALEHGGWVLLAGLLSMAAALVVGNVAKIRASAPDPGLTTEVTLLLMFTLGAYLVTGHLSVAVALGGAIAILLQFKEPMHRWAHQLGDADFRAILQFVLISLIILPVLPDRAYGPYQVLNPRNIWWMVVLIVGMNLAGYIAHKLLGARTGAALSGLLGGLISSTATTVSTSRRSHGKRASVAVDTVVILIASTVVFARVLVEIAVVAPDALRLTAPPLATLFAVLLLLSLASWLWAHPGSDNTRTETPSDSGNPSELRTAIVFGGLYALVLFAVAAAKHLLGDHGLYLVAVLSGLTDMDAITLSTSRLMQDGRLPVDTGWRLILVASLANLAFKLGLVAVLGSKSLLRRVGPLFLLGGIAGGGILWLWPG